MRPETGKDTVSEGIAYGMMISVYIERQALLRRLLELLEEPRRSESV